MLLTPDPRLVEEPGEALQLLDGLVLAGGADIDPAAYGQEAHSETADTVPERDTFEIALVRLARPVQRMYVAAFAGGLVFWLPTLQWMRLGHPAMYAAWGALSLWTHGVLASVLCHVTWTGLMVALPPGGARPDRRR